MKDVIFINERRKVFYNQLAVHCNHRAQAKDGVY